jgi:hypothetical protein
MERPGFEAVIKSLLMISAFMVSVWLACPAFSAGVPEFPSEIEAVGSGDIVEANEVKARKAATADAVRNALTEYVSEGLGDELTEEYSLRINEQVLPRAEDLVENFLILSEYSGGDRLSVFLRVKFNRDLVVDLLRESGVPFESSRSSAGDKSGWPGGGADGFTTVFVVLEGEGAIEDSEVLERHIAEEIPGVESVRIARLAKGRVVLEVVFQGDAMVLGGAFGGEWSPSPVESTFDGKAVIGLRRGQVQHRR